MLLPYCSIYCWGDWTGWDRQVGRNYVSHFWGTLAAKFSGAYSGRRWGSRYLQPGALRYLAGSGARAATRTATQETV